MDSTDQTSRVNKHTEAREHNQVPINASFNDPMDFDPEIPPADTQNTQSTSHPRNSIRRNKSKSFADLPPSPATHTISSSLRLNQNRGVEAEAEEPQRSPGFIRALNSRKSEHHRDTSSRPKSSHSRPGTPPSRGFISDEHKRKNRASVGSRFAAEAKHFFHGSSGGHSLSRNSRRKSTPAIKTTSISSNSNGSPSTSRDSTSFSSLRSRRNSASSEISSIQSHKDEFGLSKDIDVPPVPRIPKDFSNFRGTGGASGANGTNPSNRNNAIGLHSQASSSSETTAIPSQDADLTVRNKNMHSTSKHGSYSPTQVNCKNFTHTQTPVKRPSTVRRITPSSIPFFRRSSSAQNINAHSLPHNTPPPVPPISQTHLAQNSVSSEDTNGTTHSTHSATSAPSSTAKPSHRKSMLGIGLPSLLKPSSSRKSLSSSKPISSDDLSDKQSKHSSEQSTFRRRRNSLSAAIMGRRRGKSIGSGSGMGSGEVPSEPVPKIKPEYLDQEKEDKDEATTPLSSPAARDRRSKASTNHNANDDTNMLQQNNSNSNSTSNSNSNSNRTLSTSIDPQHIDSQSSQTSHETIHPDNKRDQKPATTTRIPRISSSVRTPGMQSQSQSRSPSSAPAPAATPHKATLTETAQKASEGSVYSINTSNTSNASRSKISNGGEPANTSTTSTTSDSNREMRRRVVDKSLEGQSRILSKMAIDGSKRGAQGARGKEENTISLVKTPRQGTAYTKQPTSIPTSVSSSSVASASKNTPSSTSTPKIRSVVPAVSSRSSSNTPITAKVKPPRQKEDEDSAAADEEMLAYIRRSQARRLAAGAKLSELEAMLAFPEDVHPTPRMSPREAVALYGDSLSPYERNEISSFRDVFFVGQSSKKRLATKERSSSNHGYDDDRGDYVVIKHDHLHYRYEIIGTLGKGSFGQVLECLDHKTGKSVAIKIIRNKKRFHHQALVEVKILDKLVDWDPENKHNVIMKTEHFTFRGHLCIATELLSINLYELIKANCFAGFTTVLIRRFAGQMLQSLLLMKQHNVIHCDLKPENVLLRHPAKSSIKVIDFGSSCFENEKVYTYIQSRFYRSPEVILGMEYTAAIDMWSFGAILVELHTGYPIFPGENEQEQLACLMEVLGVPDKYIIDKSSRRKVFFDSTGAPRPVVNSKGRRRRPNSKSIKSVLKSDDEPFVDFITKCLIWDPERRIKPAAALRHPFITGLPMPKPTSPSIVRSARRPSTAQPASNGHSFKVPNGTAADSKKSIISNPTPMNRHKASHSQSSANTNGSFGGHLKSPKLASISSTPRLFRSKMTSSSTPSSKVSTVSATSKY
ncbi:hypothetical protein E3P94_00281 [Wallemia ichthyophaga]|nr:hypothetical protein E3P95_00281 [Wallemia ichthyophaga]TIB05436.1 hypothetical protein E3P94_00281 [Wallemia ichthyophaga]